MNKYNIRILDEAKDDMKKIIIYIKTELKGQKLLGNIVKLSGKKSQN